MVEYKKKVAESGAAVEKQAGKKRPAAAPAGKAAKGKEESKKGKAAAPKAEKPVKAAP